MPTIVTDSEPTSVPMPPPPPVVTPPPPPPQTTAIASEPIPQPGVSYIPPEEEAAAGITPGTSVEAITSTVADESGTVITGPGAQAVETIPAHGTLTKAQLEKLWVAHGGDDSAKELAADIALCESNGYTGAINNTAYPNRPNYRPPTGSNDPEYSVGLWQINMLAHAQYAEADLLTSSGNCKAEINVDGAGEQRAAANHVYCYAVARAAEGAPGAETPPLSSPEASEPASITAAWKDILNVLGVKVPQGLDSITSNADALVNIFK